MLGQNTGGGLKLGGGTGLGLNLGVGLGQQQQGTGLQLGGGGLGMGLGQQATSQGLSLGGGLSLGAGLGGGTSGLASTNKGLIGGLNLAGTQKPLASSMSTGLGMFNVGAMTTAANTQQQLQQQQDNRLKAQLAIKAPGIFGDERDQILVKFNMLQACCGTGQGFVRYNSQEQSVDFTTDNPVCRFKTICYNRLPTLRNEDGLVSLQFKKTDGQLLTEQESMRSSLQTIIGNPSVQVIVESIRPLPDNHSEMTIYILEKSVLGSTRRLLATDVYLFLQNASRKSQLEKLGVIYLYPQTGFSEENLKAYLQTPPTGINNPQLWEQSKLENPDQAKFIPVLVVGSAGLNTRMKQQEQESKQQQSRLQILSDEINQLRVAHSVTVAKISEHKRKQIELSHRVLKVMVAQESLRKTGYSVQPAEELLRSRLEAIQSELDAPLQFKGRLNELMSQLRMQTQVPGARADQQCVLDPILLDEIRQHLGQQQGALAQLVKVIREDMEDLQCIEEGLHQTAT